METSYYKKEKVEAVKSHLGSQAAQGLLKAKCECRGMRRSRLRVGFGNAGGWEACNEIPKSIQDEQTTGEKLPENASDQELLEIVMASIPPAKSKGNARV
ncbi:hypothetical protein U1Q18_014750 [Sarracenia purpurea var. burkii]